MLRMLYFAGLVDTLGYDTEELDLPPGAKTVADLLESLRARGAPWREALAADAIRVTVNKAFAMFDTTIVDGDEIALVPKRA